MFDRQDLAARIEQRDQQVHRAIVEGHGAPVRIQRTRLARKRRAAEHHDLLRSDGKRVDFVHVMCVVSGKKRRPSAVRLARHRAGGMGRVVQSVSLIRGYRLSVQSRACRGKRSLRIMNSLSNDGSSLVRHAALACSAGIHDQIVTAALVEIMA
ncbi:hypothetical protein [Burkholderia diffusa]|uniref:hypothetical protein n=1 Tax=Burkholderia diffusa TaxID=488732 RepID=UPI002ABE51D7|nr:hypothetical protein [Burkholderia diffusa]